MRACHYLKKNPLLKKDWLPKALIFDYDPSNAPLASKRSLTLGMAMTEKQGGSDVKANLTQAKRTGDFYELLGYKWFCSAPMSDGFFVTALLEEGLSCFLVPRWREDGSKNGMEIVRLKDKLGNHANASSEVEFKKAQGYLVGEAGLGIQTIIQMVALTRFDCMVGSTALIRSAFVQALHHAQFRKAFGKTLIEQPLMKQVLSQAALELEASLLLCYDLALRLDQNHEHDFSIRLLTALGKYWICKRTPFLVAELLECLGGAGYVEDFMLARLYREAPLNAIWEGCGNIQCLDVLRTIQKDKEGFYQFLESLKPYRQEKRFEQLYQKLEKEINQLDESTSRRFVESLVTCYQASLILKHSPSFVFDVYSEFATNAMTMLGTLVSTKHHDHFLSRAWVL